eukprot:gene58208-biopygen120951
MERNRNQLDKCFLKIDFKNAFNTVDREAFLREVRLRLPGLSRWAEWCYGSASRLLFGDTVISSEVGAQQGDPLGPLFFSLVIQPIIAELAREEGDLELLYFYLDDGCIAGDHRAVARAMARLKELAARIGLELCTRKCEVIPCAGTATTMDRSVFPSDVQFPAPAVSPDWCSSFELLGCPIGDAGFCAAYIAKRVAKTTPLLDAVSDVPDPQVALVLLRQCASFGKVVYSLRVTPSEFHGNASQLFDAAVRQCFERFTGLFPDDVCWRQATLATRLGGLGLRSAVRHRDAAFLSSRSQCHAPCHDVDTCHVWEVSDPGSCAARAVRTLNAEFSESDQIPELVPEPIKQQQLSLALDNGILAALLDPAAIEPARRAQLRLQLEPGAGAWLQAMPSHQIGNAIS